MSPAELKQLVRRHQRELWRYLRFLGAEPREAESLVREVFLEASKSPPKQSNQAAVAAYLRSVARHKLVTALKRVGRRPAVPDLDQADAEWFLFAGASGGEERIERLKAGGDPLQDSAEGSLDRIRLLELFQQEASGQCAPPDVWRRLKRRVERPAEIGGYRIVEEIAAGAMGVVYKAHDPNMNREVAIKLIRSEKEDERHRKRFRAEARALAKLNHPNVVRVHSAGDYEGSHYMVMAFVRGESLQDRLDREGAIPDRDLAGLMLKLSEALQHCHDNAVLHRDLKPLNILLDHTGEPMLTDFGLAADLEANSGSSVSFIGTPGFWPPEQARGKTELIGERSDVYGLGATIYACLTGRPPYGKGASLQETLELMQKPLAPPSETRPVDPDLEAICLRCLAELPEDRFASARELAADLQRYLDGRPVESSPSSPSAPAARGRSRARTLVLGAGLGVALLALAGFAALGVLEGGFSQASDQLTELKRLEEGHAEASAEMEAALTAGRAALRRGDVAQALARASAGGEAFARWKGGFDQLEFPENRADAVRIRQEQLEPLRRQHVELTVLQARALLAKRTPAVDSATALLEPLERESWSARLALAQGELLEARGEFVTAIERYARSHQISGQLFEGYLAEARVLTLVDRLDDALLTLDGALQELGTPEGGRERDLRRDLLLARCVARRVRGRAADAVEDALEAARYDRGWRPLALLGLAEAAAGRGPEALDALERAVAAKPGAAGPQEALAEALRLLGRLEEAHAAADRAVQADPLHVSSQALRAELGVELGRDDVDVDLQGVLRQSRAPRLRARAYFALAQRQVYAGQLADARSEVRAGLAVHPTSFAGRELLARLELAPYFEGQFVENAEATLRGFPRWRRESAEVLWLLGRVQAEKYARDPGRALRFYEQALNRDPQHAGAHASQAVGLERSAERDRGPGRAGLERSAWLAWLKSVREGRDPRDPAGRAYVEGLRQERRAAEGHTRAQVAARHAFRRVIWRRPLHEGALLGLARLASTEKERLRALRAARRCKQAIAPQAALAVALAERRLDLEDRSLFHAALKRRGATWALAAAALRVEAEKLAKRDLLGALKRLAIGFEDLRRRHYARSLELVEAERRVLERFARSGRRQDTIAPRLKAISEADRAFRVERKRRRAASAQALRRARAAPNGKLALNEAQQAVKAWPWSRDAWSALGKARASQGDPWGALTAHTLAGDGDVGALVDALRQAGLAGGAAPLTRNLERPLSVDERTLLESAPVVARCFAGVNVPTAEVRTVFTRLEELASVRPRDLRASLFLGALALGVGRNDYAVRELLFVGQVLDASRAYYLAAVGAARRPTALAASCAVTYLREAIRGDRGLLQKAKTDPQLAGLRKQSVWSLLGS